MSAPTRSGGAGPAEAGVLAQPQAGGLKRELKNRHIQMIALGGAIGTGLFYGSADSIGLAGPAILLAYLIGGTVIFLVVRALGEMSVDEPVSGAFSHYAYKNWSPRAGFVSGWNYWFNYIAVSMAELSVVGLYVNYWFPGVPKWLSAAFFLVAITAVNLLGVRAYGEFEFWFALIKVVAVIGMIVLGIVVVVLGINHNASLPDPSFGHLVHDGGFFAQGVSGMLMALVVVMFSFGGIELIGITAGEADNPKRTISRAVNQVVYRILIFYIGALAVIMAVIPWTKIDGKESPFVQIFDNIGIGGAAHILNFVVLTAALSVYNSGTYCNGRMLVGLAEQGDAPRALAKVDKRGVPVRALLVSALVTFLAVVVNYDLPRSTDDYVHRIGRTARAGARGIAVSFVSAGSEAHMRLIEKRQGVRLVREQVAGFEPVEVATPAQEGAGVGGIKGKRPSKKDKLRAAAKARGEEPQGGAE